MRTVQILALASILALGLACSQPEQRVLTTFVNALQAGDEAAAAQVSLVKFPGEEVTTWEIVEVGPESSAPFQLANMQAERAKKVKQLESMIERNDLFLQDNEELYYKYKPRKDKDPEATFEGKLKEFDEELTARLEEMNALDQEIKDAGEELDRLKKAAALSTNTPGLGSSYDGDVLAREATVKFNDKNYTVVLKQYALVNTEHNMRPVARWIITDIRE